MWQFVIFLGFVSLFTDICYEGARSITGPYLALLGANAAVVGIVSGSGELIGYGFRYISGSLSDKPKHLWPLTLLGYAINLLSIPFLALTGSWVTASFLIILERAGKALRSPPRDVMLSYASEKIGQGTGFGVHKALDQTGALLGPFLITALLYFYHSYRLSFALLLIPALISLTILFIAKALYPNPHEFQNLEPRSNAKNLTKDYWIYLAALSCIAMGYADFPLIAYHFQKQGFVPPLWIPIFYGIAMGCSGLAALCLGRLYDRMGLSVLIFISALTAFVAPFVLGSDFYEALGGMILWGIGMGAHDSVMNAFIAKIVAPNKRGRAYGMFSMLFGISWFLGSSAMGILYDFSITAMVIFSVAVQLVSLPFFFILRYRSN